MGIRRKSICAAGTIGRSPSSNSATAKICAAGTLGRSPSSDSVGRGQTAKYLSGPRRGRFDIVVGHVVIECRRLCELPFGQRETFADTFRVIGPAIVQTGSQRVEMWGMQEDEHRVGKLLLDRERSLDLDLQQDRAPACQRLTHAAPQRAIAVAAEVGPFEEGTVGDQLVELLISDEVVVHAVTLAGSGRPGRG